MAFSIVLDTETAPMFGRKTPQPEPWNSLVYDLGGVVVDNKSGDVVESFSFAISETFADPRTMGGAYYADKLPKYYEGMGYTDSATWDVVTFREARAYVFDLCKRYDVRKAWAFNAKFDEAALNNSTRYFSNGFACFFLPYGVKWADIWDYADCVTSSRKYLEFCERHNLFTPKGNPKTSAESVYAFITDNPEHVEKHTALSDATEEAAILAYARHKHCKKSTTKGKGWKAASVAWQAYKSGE